MKYPAGLNVITRVLIKRSQKVRVREGDGWKGRMVKERIKERFEDVTLLALKMEERVMSQGMQAA